MPAISTDIMYVFIINILLLHYYIIIIHYYNIFSLDKLQIANFLLPGLTSPFCHLISFLLPRTDWNFTYVPLTIFARWRLRWHFPILFSTFTLGKNSKQRVQEAAVCSCIMSSGAHKTRRHASGCSSHFYGCVCRLLLVNKATLDWWLCQNKLWLERIFWVFS